MIRRSLAAAALALSALTMLSGCGGGSNNSGGSTPTPPPVSPPPPTPSATLRITTTSLPTAYAGTPYSVQLSATNGTPPYTWSASSNPANVVVSSTGLFSGTPDGASCSIPLVVQVADSSTPQQTASASLPFTSTAIDNDLHPGQVNVYFQGAFALECAPEPISWAIISGTLPTGLTGAPFPGDDGEFNLPGIPTQSGNFPITVQSTDGAGHVSQLSAVVNILPSSLVSSDSVNLHAIANQSYTHTVALTGGTAPYNFNLTSGSLPAGLSLDSVTGVITGTPSSPGYSQFTLHITDSTNTTLLGFAFNKPYTLVVTPAVLPSRNDTLATATPIYPGSYVLSFSPYTGTAGSLAPDQDYFLLSGTSGTAYTVFVSAEYSLWDSVQSFFSFNTSPAQPAIEIVDSNGARLATCNDSVAGSASSTSPYPRSPGNFTDPCVSFQPAGLSTSSSLALQRLPADQPLYLHVFDFYGRARPDLFYTLTINSQ